MSIHFLYLSSSAVGRQWFAVSSHFGGRTYRIETSTNCDSGPKHCSAAAMIFSWDDDLFMMLSGILFQASDS